MKPHRPFRLFASRSRRGNAQRGYALLMAVFLGALMLVAVTAAAPNILTQGRRDKEDEMIWRGEQYARAVRLFYRKNGRFPTSIDELVEKRTQVRYLRQRYKDPMNSEDGSWRLIYIGPGGQLIGSITRTGALQFPAAQPGQQPGKSPGAGGTPGATPLQPTFGPRPSAQPSPVSDAVIGGNIIGVASKVEQPSLKVYKERSTYKEWEFIWDPTRDAQVPGSPGFGVPQPGTRPPGTQQPPQRP
jgi:type II secretory pathway pseudopilin PulG